MKSDFPIKKNDRLRLEVTAMSFAGLGIARYSDPAAKLENFVFFISGSVVGDVCDCVVLKVSKTYGYAKIVKIITPSPDRITADCPVFGKCGGCSFLNTDYRAELKYKGQTIAAAFAKAGFQLRDANTPPCDNSGLPTIPAALTREGIPAVESSPEISGYRNKVLYPLSPDSKFGFYARASHRCCEGCSCELQDELFEQVAQTVREFITEFGITPYNEALGTGLFRHLYLRRAKHTGQLLVCLVLTEKKLPHCDELIRRLRKFDDLVSVYVNVNRSVGNTILGEEYIRVYGNEKIEDTLCGLKFRISPAAFWQINTLQAERLYMAAISSAQITAKDTVLDLYCGTGSIAIVTAAKTKAKRVIGIEVVGQAISDAKENAVLNGIKNCDFFSADAADTYEVLKDACRGKDMPNVVIIDPPRKGLEDQAIRELLKIAPERIIYISCDVHTQARDIAKLVSAESPHLSSDKENEVPGTADNIPHYRVVSSHAYDMFPRTPHVENIICLEKTGK